MLVHSTSCPPFPIFVVQAPSSPMPVYLREDVEWIAAVDQIFNPMKAHPDDALKGEIGDQWDDAITFFVLSDLRTCTFKGGRRTHLWVEMTCMIAYFLTPLPALCRLINFEDLSNADVFDFGPKFFHQFVSDTTCIFYPQYSRLTSLKVSHTFVCPGIISGRIILTGYY
jgi:hypothetical protein